MSIYNFYGADPLFGRAERFFGTSRAKMYGAGHKKLHLTPWGCVPDVPDHVRAPTTAPHARQNHSCTCRGRTTLHE